MKKRLDILFPCQVPLWKTFFKKIRQSISTTCEKNKTKNAYSSVAWKDFLQKKSVKHTKREFEKTKTKKGFLKTSTKKRKFKKRREIRNIQLLVQKRNTRKGVFFLSLLSKKGEKSPLPHKFQTAFSALVRQNKICLFVSWYTLCNHNSAITFWRCGFCAPKVKY
jgi:hypothetical protein